MEPDKVKAVYELREAAEEHGRIEARLGSLADQTSRRRLLDARLRLEEKTHEAIEACHACGLPHFESEPPCKPPGNQVIQVDFSQKPPIDP